MARENLDDAAVMPYTVTIEPGTNKRIPAEAKGLLGIRATVTHKEYHLHLGETWRTTWLSPIASPIANNGIVDIFIEAGSQKSLHLSDIFTSHLGVFEHSFFDERNGAITPNVGSGIDLKTGASRTTWGASGDYPLINTNANQILANPTYSAITVPLWSVYLEAGTTGSRVPVVQDVDEYIIKAGTAAVLRFKNLSGLTSRFSIKILYVEESPGGLGDV